MYRRAFLTTLATLAATSRSVDRAAKVESNADIKEVERRDKSRRHSVVSALKIFNVISRDLGIMSKRFFVCM